MISFFFVRLVQKFSCMQMEKRIRKRKSLIAANKQWTENCTKNCGLCVFSLTGSSRTTLKKTNDMAPMVCLYALPCPVPCYICFYLYTTNLVHIHIDMLLLGPLLYAIIHIQRKKANSHRRASHQFYSSSSSTV